jgi:hypothetical protein
MLLGQGSLTCSTWLAGVERPSPDPEQVSWTWGYISAVAASTPLRQVSASYVRGAVEGHCKRDQTATIEAATKAIVANLKTSPR